MTEHFGLEIGRGWWQDGHWARDEGWMIPHPAALSGSRGCESLRGGNGSAERRLMSPSAPGGLPSIRWICPCCLAGPEWLWKEHTGSEPWRKPLEIHEPEEPPDSSAWAFSPGAHLDEEVLQCDCTRWVLTPPLAPPDQT